MKHIFLLLLIFSASTVLAQDQEIIKRDFQTIIKYTSQMKIDEVLNMTYPKLFNVMPKAQMSAMGKGMLSGMGIKMIYEQVPVNLKMTPVKPFPKGSICLGKYNQSMVLEAADANMLGILTQTKLKDNVIEKLGKNKVRIKGSAYLLAIKDAYTKNTWKYLRYDEENADVNAKILSKEIIKTVEEMKTSIK
ncbi:hypothetical protein OQX63_02945 [Pedobacter sp. PF22-3]|uniref:hypothetical protein n=1 Tax=Pedobacter sp. PF22-3 TaxID=2994467 RepID=UPI002245072A|nr:hypothetical protein [Pedobacter sp. PF22-3]MCX2492411.1 hypothetical protein [Pedobacter sp. PF22-3]